MGKQKRQPESFDVSEFLRPTDQDMKSALISILGPGSGHDSQLGEAQAGASLTQTSELSDDTPPRPDVVIIEDVSPPASRLAVEGIDKPNFNQNSRLKNNSLSKPFKRGITSVDSSFDISFHLRTALAAYRLNRSELSLYEIFLTWTHAVGKTQCEATNRKICEVSGLIEKSVRRNLKSLNSRGLVVQVKAYDPSTQEPALYDVSLPPLATNSPR
jgi:hypothetical protein